MRKTQELLCPGVSSQFCSSLLLPTAFKSTSPSHLNHRKVCPLSLFDLYLQRCLFCCRFCLHFDKCCLTDLPLTMALGFMLAGDGPKRRMVRWLLPSCHGCIPNPTTGCLAPSPAKTLPGPPIQWGQVLAAHLYLDASFPNPVISSDLCSDPQFQPTLFMDQIKAFPIAMKLQLPSNIPLLCSHSSTLTALHCASQLTPSSTTHKFFRATCPLHFSMH